MKTIKELEKSIGVSKVSLYSMLKKQEFKSHVFKGEKNITLIDEVGEQLLIAYYSKEQSETINDIITDELYNGKASSKEDSKDADEVKNVDIIRILQDQLKEKDNQINNLLSIISNQQKLHATQLLTDKQDIVNSDNEPVKPETKGFLNKLFKRLWNNLK